MSISFVKLQMPRTTNAFGNLIKKTHILLCLQKFIEKNFFFASESISVDDFFKNFFIYNNLGQIEFAELLISHGANVNIADENRRTALHLAVEECRFKFIL